MGKLTRLALTRSIDRAELAAEIDAQLQSFEDAMQAPPDFIDGHQHAHALPLIRDVLVKAIIARYGAAPPYLRNPVDTPAAIVERGIAVGKALSVSDAGRRVGDDCQSTWHPGQSRVCRFQPF